MPSALLLDQIMYQGEVNRLLLAAGAGSGGPMLTMEQLEAMERARLAGRTASEFVAQINSRRPSQWQINTTAVDCLTACECGHPKYQHNDDGRCRARRHRCSCRTFVAQRQRAGAA